MTVLRNLRKLVLGETWVLPLSLLALLAGAAALRALSLPTWHAAGPVLLPAGVVAVLAAAVWRSLPRR
jgi:hypothetical protein